MRRGKTMFVKKFLIVKLFTWNVLKRLVLILLRIVTYFIFGRCKGFINIYKGSKRFQLFLNLYENFMQFYASEPAILFNVFMCCRVKDDDLRSELVILAKLYTILYEEKQEKYFHLLFLYVRSINASDI